MASFLQSIFADKLESDTRDASFVVNVPGIDRSFGLLLPSLSLWAQLSQVLMIQTAINVALAVFVFRFIVQKRGEVSAFLVGYGFVIPIVLAMPYYVIEALDLRNMSFMMSVASTPTLAVFRCLEAMHGTSPAVVENDMRTYCTYYCAVIQFRFDPNTKKAMKATTDELFTKAQRFLTKFLMLGALYSIMIPSLYMPFPSPISYRNDQQSYWDFLNWGHLLNNLVLAYLTHLSLDTGTIGVGLGISLISGRSTMYLNNNPLFASKSISDFWGRRWNLLVHGVLKRGVFIPVRRYFSKPIAATVTFVASGMLHEYIISVVALKHQHDLGVDRNHRYVPSYGKHLSFFAWNAAMMAMENTLGGKSVLSWTGKHLPGPVTTALVIMTVLPVSHWFTHEYVASGFYTDFSYGFPMIVRM